MHTPLHSQVNFTNWRIVWRIHQTVIQSLCRKCRKSIVSDQTHSGVREIQVAIYAQDRAYRHDHLLSTRAIQPEPKTVLNNSLQIDLELKASMQKTVVA